MSEFDDKPLGTGQAGQSESLQLQLTLQLLALVLMAATLAFFFYVQSHRAKFDLNTLKPTATAMIASFEQEQPSVNAFIAKIAEYGRTHPDFAPILQKYQIPPPTNTPPPIAPKPAAPVPKK